MIRNTFTVLVLSLALALCSLPAYGDTEMKTKKMYFFGIARNYTDSIACLTDINAIDSVALDNHTHGVANIEIYTDQYIAFLKQQGKEGYICATFYSDKYKDIEKIFLKQRKRLERSKGLKIDTTTSTGFKYNYVDPKQIYRNYVEPETPEEGSEEK